MSVLSKKETELLDALEPRAASEGVEIVTVQVVGAKKAPTIRVFIDTPEGVSFDELAKAQAWINDIMDALDPFPGAYTLEVSSPGIDRPLRTEQHFARYAGQQAVVKLAHPIDGRSNFTGTIVSADGGRPPAPPADRPDETRPSEGHRGFQLLAGAVWRKEAKTWQVLS